MGKKTENAVVNLAICVVRIAKVVIIKMEMKTVNFFLLLPVMYTIIMAVLKALKIDFVVKMENFETVALDGFSF